MTQPSEKPSQDVGVGPNGTPAVAVAGAPTGWASNLTAYREKVALKFSTKAALRAALRLFWHERAFFGLPRYYVGDWTLVVPAVAVAALRCQGLDFTVQPVALPGETSAERLNELRAAQGPR
ncbi:MAG TPA: hypothetical protein VEL76_30025 [Gemmataceae bacterium]|nr:hypothetical protein [Gemmataceae bacterium]